MYKMTKAIDVLKDRRDKISFIIGAIESIEGVRLQPYHFHTFTEEQLNKEAEWYDYLLDK